MGEPLSIASGVQIGPCRLETLLGRGGFGEVWSAQLEIGPKVAVKVISTRGVEAEADRLAKYERDAVGFVKRNAYKSILDLYAFLQISETQYAIIMQLADGTLARYARADAGQSNARDRLSPDLLLKYMEDVAAGIDHLNLHDIGHRDIKPANLLLVGDQVKIGDFGFARFFPRSIDSASMVGTLGYMPHECFGGKYSKDRSDQFSLACTYFVLRTGRMIFSEPDMVAHLCARTQLPDLKPFLDNAEERDVIHRAIRQKPEERWPSCREFVAALRSAVFAGRRGNDLLTSDPCDSAVELEQAASDVKQGLADWKTQVDDHLDLARRNRRIAALVAATVPIFVLALLFAGWIFDFLLLVPGYGNSSLKHDMAGIEAQQRQLARQIDEMNDTNTSSIDKNK